MEVSFHNRTNLIAQCTQEAVHHFATYRIFRKISQSLSRKRKWLTFLGLAAPLGIGVIVFSWGQSSPLIAKAVTIASILGAAQLSVTLYSLVASWEEKYYNAKWSTLANNRLFRQFDELRTSPPADIKVFIRKSRNWISKLVIRTI